MKLLKYIASIPLTIYGNFKYLQFKQAVYFPLAINWDTKLIGGGNIEVCSSNIKPGMIRIGFHEVPVCDPSDKSVMVINGKLIFNGSAHLGHGSKIHVTKGAKCILGDNFAISASSAINCYKHIEFGNDIQFSWDCLVMDSDTHCIYGENGIQINEARKIVFGDKIWIGCRSTVLKGSIVPDNCVIGACSVVSGSKFEKNSIIVGNPAKSIKRIKKWEL